MASRIKLWPKNLLLILICFLFFGVLDFAVANEERMILHRESPKLEQYATYSIDKEIYTAEEMSYFKEIALQVEYGSQMNRIHKWTKELHVKIMGYPSSEDKRALDSTLEILNELSENLKLRYASENEQANVQVYFIPHSEFMKHTSITSIQESIFRSNWGLAAVWWNKQGEIYQAEILIATDFPNAVERAHLIREELTQSLGLLNDSWKEPESIFYQGWGTQDYTMLDKKLIQILYNGKIRPNMQEKDIERVLVRLT
jgi:hypothetical protein